MTEGSLSDEPSNKGMKQPQYRLRVGEIRVFYDVIDKEVHVLAIVSKAEA